MKIDFRERVKHPGLILLAALNLACVQISEELSKDALPPRMRDRICDHKVSGQRDKETGILTPTVEVDPADYPDFTDDLDFSWMDLAIKRQLERFRERELKGTIRFGNRVYPTTSLVSALVTFNDLMQSVQGCVRRTKTEPEKKACYQKFNEAVRTQFRVFKPDLAKEDPRYGEKSPVFFTGYYTPLLEVSLARQGPYQFPIYARPQPDRLRRMPRFDIDFKEQLRGQALEIFWAKDLFDLYLLHLEGGGRVRYLQEGQVKSQYISFAGANGRAWRFLAVLMLDRGWIETPTISAQREFLQNNTSLHPEIYSYCPSYVYFRETDHPPEGSDRVPLTDMRSVATDSTLYSLKGTLAFVSGQHIKTEEAGDISFHRFVVDQDTGGAIKGKARVDFYFGEGDYAEFAAHNLKGRGDLFFLLPRNEGSAEK